MCVTAALQETAATNNAWHVWLDDEPFAELFHDNHRIDRAAAKAAIFFAERSHQQAELSELRPHFRTPARLGLNDLATGFEVVLFPDQPGKAVADHGLLFGEIEVHLVSSLPRTPYRPRIIFEIMLR